LGVGAGFRPEVAGACISEIEEGIKTPGEGTESNSCEEGSDESTPTARPTAGSPHPAIINSKASKLVRRTD